MFAFHFRSRAASAAILRLLTVALVFAVPAIAPAESPRVGLRPPGSALACAACHGSAGQGEGSIPAIAGLAPARFVGMMQAFRDGRRPATVMQRIARGYGEAEYRILAQYFAELGK